MREMKYFLIEELEDDTKVTQYASYRKIMDDYKRLKKEHPENTYRVAIQ